MMRLLPSAALLTILAGCIMYQPAAPESSTTVGTAEPADLLGQATYQLQSAGGCGMLTRGPTNSFRWDAACDGIADYVAGRVDVSGDTVRMDGARINITSITDTGFTGLFVLRGAEMEIVATAV